MKKVLFAVFVIFIVATGYYLIKNPNLLSGNPTPSNGKYTCTRTERYKNPPEVDRALSLIDQRFSTSQMDTMGFSGEVIKEKDYWHNLLSCIVVEYRDIKSEKGAEGYFLFDSKTVKPDYLPVYIDKSYSQVDDVTLALLLVHEITHAGQYLYLLNGAVKLDCYTEETAAFASQWNFVNRLNSEERKNLEVRLNSNLNHPQLELVRNMLTTYWNGKKACGTDESCAYNKVVDSLEQMIKSTPFYQQECTKT